MSIVVAAALVGSFVLLVAALEALVRAAGVVPTETRARPLGATARHKAASRPPELARLEQLVSAAAAGDGAACRRLARRLADLGVDLGPGPLPEALSSALDSWELRAGGGRPGPSP